MQNVQCCNTTTRATPPKRNPPSAPTQPPVTAQPSRVGNTKPTATPIHCTYLSCQRMSGSFWRSATFS